MALAVKNLPTNARDVGFIPGLWRSSGGGHGLPLQYSCLENPMDRGACQATVHGIAKSWTWLKWLNTHTHAHTYMYTYGWVPSIFTWNYHNIVNQLYEWKSLSCVRLFATPWTVAHQSPLSMEFSRQEYWSEGWYFLLQGIFLPQEVNPGLLHCRQIL